MERDLGTLKSDDSCPAPSPESLKFYHIEKIIKSPFLNKCALNRFPIKISNRTSTLLQTQTQVNRMKIISNIMETSFHLSHNMNRRKKRRKNPLNVCYCNVPLFNHIMSIVIADKKNSLILLFIHRSPFALTLKKVVLSR